MKISQKITFILLFWSSLSVLSCKKIVEPIQNGEYIYKNILSSQVILNVYGENSITWSKHLNAGDSLVIKISGDVGATPFQNEPIGGSKKVMLDFGNNKCVTYTFDTSSNKGNGVFDHTKYSNYSNEIISAYSEKAQRIHYEFVGLLIIFKYHPE